MQWLHLTNYCKKYLQNFKYNVKRVYIFHLILVGIPSILILSVKNTGWVFLLNRQNPLSVTKVICRQSLSLNTVKANLLKTYLILPKTNNLN